MTMGLGMRIRAARESVGMDQSTLAKAAGVPQPTLSALESRDSNRSNYADQLIKALPADKVNLNWVRTGTGSMTDVAELTADYVEEAGASRTYRRVPVVGTAKMGDDGFYDEMSSMPGAGDGHIEIATEDPNAYCLRVRGQSMFPAIRDGWYVLIEPNGTPSEGEYVLIRLKDGRKMVKEFMYRRMGTIELMSVNGQERISIELSDLDEERGMQAVGAVVSPSKWRPE